eukprot:GEMP01006195.1.p1 GENE.GEMP01006195.1~~GEMP01006195.1.p1  ORF type:complete len:1003 (+),score=237.89 GEMP01006195.1:99-3107(+)
MRAQDSPHDDSGLSQAGGVELEEKDCVKRFASAAEDVGHGIRKVIEERPSAKKKLHKQFKLEVQGPNLEPQDWSTVVTHNKFSSSAGIGLPGWHLALESFVEGEVSVVEIPSNLAFGDMGCQVTKHLFVPPRAPVYYRFRVVTPPVRTPLEEGREALGRKAYRQALKAFRRARDAAADDDELRAAMLNESLSLLKLADVGKADSGKLYRELINVTSTILSKFPDGEWATKTLLRRGRAYERMDELDLAKKDFEGAGNVEGLHRIREQKRAWRVQERAQWVNIVEREQHLRAKEEERRVIEQKMGAVDFKYRDYAEITTFFKKLQQDHGDIVEVFDALKKWPDIAPDKTDLPRCGNSPCEWLVVHITNLTSYKQNPLTPEMYISGCLHGDEIIGPNIVTEYAGFLAAEYEKNPDITHMLNTRSLWITPMTNAAGYHAIKREESNAKGESYDPNRDFPYNDFYQDGGKSCMKTIAARVVAELYRHQMIQISITMHSGISSLTYLWGSPNHAKKLPNCSNSNQNACVTTPGCCASTDAPDAKAFRAIGQSMYRAFGSVSGSCARFVRTPEKQFPPRPHRDQSGKCWYFGKAEPSTDAVYAVNGGMEDFSYAYSWEGKLQHVGKNPIPDKCSSNHYGGYNMEVKEWNQSVKQVNYLIEATDKKDVKSGYGNPGQLSRSSNNDGHVARHIRAFLRLLELLHPEIKVDTENNNFHGIGCHTIEARVVKWARSASDGACTTVPEKPVNHHKYNSPTQCRGLRLWQNIDEKEASSATSGIFDLSKLNLDSGKWCYAIVASFDAEWANQDDTTPDPKVPPQSHLVNARTQPNYQVPNASGTGPRINATKDHFIPLTHINDAGATTDTPKATTETPTTTIAGATTDTQNGATAETTAPPTDTTSATPETTSTTTILDSNAGDKKKKDGLSLGIILGIVGAAVVVFIVAALSLFFLCKKRTSAEADNRRISAPPPAQPVIEREKGHKHKRHGGARKTKDRAKKRKGGKKERRE